MSLDTEKLTNEIVALAEDFLESSGDNLNRFRKEVANLLNKTTGDKNFIVYWRDGRFTKVTGVTIEDAFTKAGYGRGAVGGLDFYAEGSEPEYAWNASRREWEKNGHGFHDTGMDDPSAGFPETENA